MWLTEKLAAEHPAILRWAIDGALAWRRMGLEPPARVRQARDHHLESEDMFGIWFAEQGEAVPSAWTSSAELYASWVAWADATGEIPGSHKRFSQWLDARGFTPKRLRTGTRGFTGLRLTTENASSVIGLWAAPLR